MRVLQSGTLHHYRDTSIIINNTLAFYCHKSIDAMDSHQSRNGYNFRTREKNFTTVTIHNRPTSIFAVIIINDHENSTHHPLDLCGLLLVGVAPWN